MTTRWGKELRQAKMLSESRGPLWEGPLFCDPEIGASSCQGIPSSVIYHHVLKTVSFLVSKCLIRKNTLATNKNISHAET